jgi:hypothetical protein
MDLFTDGSDLSRISNATAAEQTAFVRALILTLWADGRITVLEESEFARVTDSIRWKMDINQEYLTTAAEAKAALQEQEKMPAYIRDIVSRVNSNDLMTSILNVCNQVSYQPGGIERGRIVFLIQLEKAFASRTT